MTSEVKIPDPLDLERDEEARLRAAAGLLQSSREHRIVVGLREDGDPVGDERVRSVEQFERIGQQRALVRDHLELDPVGLQGLTRHPCRADGFGRGAAAGGVGGVPVRGRGGSG